MCFIKGNDADNRRHHQRDPPPEKFGDLMVDKMRIVGGVFVVCPVPPREEESENVYRDDKHQHHRLDQQQQIALFESDHPFRE